MILRMTRYRCWIAVYVVLLQIGYAHLGTTDHRHKRPPVLREKNRPKVCEDIKLPCPLYKLYADPRHCQVFYECGDPTQGTGGTGTKLYKNVCPPDTVYDHVSESCVWRSLTDCNDPARRWCNETSHHQENVPKNKAFLTYMCIAGIGLFGVIIGVAALIGIICCRKKKNRRKNVVLKDGGLVDSAIDVSVVATASGIHGIDNQEYQMMRGQHWPKPVLQPSAPQLDKTGENRYITNIPKPIFQANRLYPSLPREEYQHQTSAYPSQYLQLQEESSKNVEDEGGRVSPSYPKSFTDGESNVYEHILPKDTVSYSSHAYATLSNKG